jgi:hypothetical protein
MQLAKSQPSRLGVNMSLLFAPLMLLVVDTTLALLAPT